MLHSNGLTVYEDYAHHPTEIRALLGSLRREREGRLVVVGAEYALETGEVDFFDGVPPSGGASHES